MLNLFLDIDHFSMEPTGSLHKYEGACARNMILLTCYNYLFNLIWGIQLKLFKRSAHSAWPTQWVSGSVAQWMGELAACLVGCLAGWLVVVDCRWLIRRLVCLTKTEVWRVQKPTFGDAKSKKIWFGWDFGTGTALGAVFANRCHRFRMISGWFLGAEMDQQSKKNRVLKPECFCQWFWLTCWCSWARKRVLLWADAYAGWLFLIVPDHVHFLMRKSSHNGGQRGPKSRSGGPKKGSENWVSFWTGKKWAKWSMPYIGPTLNMAKTASQR